MIKYHNHKIEKVPVDLGEEDSRLNHEYRIYDSNSAYVGTALTLSTAKDYIDSGYDDNYL